MVELSLHDYLVMVSFVASIVGLVLLGDRHSGPTDDRTLNEEMLMKMSFLYWLLATLKLTTVLSYLLTVSSILSLPLQRMAVRQVKE
ncbi:MAG: hypothetical protein ACBR12_08850 [Microcoleus sp.]